MVQGGHFYHVSPGCCLSDVCADCSNSTPTLLHIKHRGPASFFYYTSFISQLHYLRLDLLHTLSVCIFSSHFLKTNERILQDDENGTKTLQTNRNLECVVSRETCSTITSWIKLFHLTGRSCPELSERRTTAGRGEVDSVFTSLM